MANRYEQNMVRQRKSNVLGQLRRKVPCLTSCQRHVSPEAALHQRAILRRVTRQPRDLVLFGHATQPQGAASHASEESCVCGACMPCSHGAPRMAPGVPGVRMDQVRCTQTLPHAVCAHQDLTSIQNLAPWNATWGTKRGKGLKVHVYWAE